MCEWNGAARPAVGRLFGDCETAEVGSGLRHREREKERSVSPVCKLFCLPPHPLHALIKAGLWLDPKPGPT